MASNSRKRTHSKAFGSKRALCMIAAIICVLPGGSSAESVPPEHMRRDLSKLLNRRDTSNGTLSITVSNNCTEDIYPGISTQNGNPPSPNGFRLQPGESQIVTVNSNWQGRIWPRTNCTFPNPNAPNKACDTGDCAGSLNCTVSGIPPVTLAEFTCDGGDNQAYYDISLVDGFSISMAILLITTGVSALSNYPPNKTNPSCIASLSNFIADFNPYGNSNDIPYLGTNQSTQLPFVQGLTNDKVSQWCPWDCQVNPPKKPGAGVYPYPDGNIQRPIFQPCYSTCAKWNQPQDCCTGSYNSPSVCKPGLYSKNAKSVCPDAYTFAYDDKDSTFVVPKGGNYEVVFCPPGRSTSIIANSSAQAIAKQHGGLTSSANTESISPSWILACVALIFTAGVFSML